MRFLSMCLISILVVPLFCFANDDVTIKQLFEKYHVNGTLVVSSLGSEKQYIYNEQRSLQGFVPASTFKILNTLIALDEGVITKKSIFKWDGKDKGWEAWNKDQTLKSAFGFSCVWCYQQVASQVGNAKYLNHFKRVGYGNEKTGPNVQRFWLDGDLRVSAQQQIEFIRKVYKENLPYSEEDITTLKHIMVQDSNDNYTLYAKTGWSQKIGWFVGFVDSKSGPWLFALNMDMPDIKQAPIRKKIVVETLKLKGLL
ncbi:class D beta-lactamase [Zooshikella harenae]|uniref:Beta-lactamase n=1 Tax=Zooshikella harenae TaxID=2827238 RepID=A0ABS5Z6F7_9GAMM|nr:class D beta-lactamase [Zooshikella harenae]MBU2709637.1 class D beta-lactamase [Zooshikella harenae]